MGMTYEKINIEAKIDKIEKIINDWKKRNLTMLGRITIAKSLLLPNITYIISNTVLKQQNIQKIKTSIYNYIWNSKVEKVKR